MYCGNKYRNTWDWMNRLSRKYFNGSMPRPLELYLDTRYSDEMNRYDWCRSETELEAAMERDCQNYANGTMDEAMLKVVECLLDDCSEKEDVIESDQEVIDLLKETIQSYRTFITENEISELYFRWKHQQFIGAGDGALEIISDKEDQLYDLLDD